MKSERNDILIHINFLTKLTISLFHFCENVFTLMHDWEKFNEILLPENKDFYSHLNMEDITDADYTHGERVCKDFERKTWGQYHDLYLQSITLLLTDVFENFRNMSLEIYELDPAHFISSLRLAW